MSRNPACEQSDLARKPALPGMAQRGRHPCEIVTFRRAEPIVLQRIIIAAAPWRSPAKARGKPMSQSSFRRDFLTQPIFRPAQQALPRPSATHAEPVTAGGG